MTEHPQSMRAFRKQRPDVRVQLFDADLPTLIRMVEAGKLDMSLGIFKACLTCVGSLSSASP